MREIQKIHNAFLTCSPNFWDLCTENANVQTEMDFLNISKTKGNYFTFVLSGAMTTAVGTTINQHKPLTFEFLQTVDVYFIFDGEIEPYSVLTCLINCLILQCYQKQVSILVNKTVLTKDNFQTVMQLLDSKNIIKITFQIKQSEQLNLCDCSAACKTC